MPNYRYKTILADSSAEYIVQRSRFVGLLRKVESLEDVARIRQAIPQEYPKANHYCWAYRIRTPSPQEHCSDAGEPHGTAGRPILGALKKHSLENVLCVVVRYFGGIKLGVRGLIAAYGQCALLAVEASQIIETEPMVELSCELAYDVYDTFARSLERLGIETLEARFEFAEQVRAWIRCPVGEKERIESLVREMAFD